MQSEAEDGQRPDALTEKNLYEIIAALQGEVIFLKNKYKELEEERKDASEGIKMFKDKHKELEEQRRYRLSPTII